MSDVEESAMSIVEHLTELRKRIMWCILAFFLGFMILFPFADDLLRVILKPVIQAMIERGLPAILQTTSPQEEFFTLVRVSMLGGFLVAFPVVAYQLWAFVSPGLYKNERGAALPFILAAPIMFIIGSLFSHYIVSPLAMNFFIGFSDVASVVTGEKTAADAGDFLIQFDGKLDQVLDITLKLIFAFGLCFQLPVALTLLGKVGLVSADGLKAARKYAIVGIMFVSAIVTPPDVITQLILFTVVYGLYEISVQLVGWVQPQYDEVENE